MTSTMRKIRLELARNEQFPEGSVNHGYEFTAPLTDDGHIDAAAWRKERARCTVRRFWQGADEQRGHLVHTASRRWKFDYDPNTKADDESGWKFDAHVFKVGEYVSVTEQDGVTRTFRVAAIG